MIEWSPASTAYLIPDQTYFGANKTPVTNMDSVTRNRVTTNRVTDGRIPMPGPLFGNRRKRTERSPKSPCIRHGVVQLFGLDSCALLLFGAS
jgi:hypothetical protein